MKKFLALFVVVAFVCVLVSCAENPEVTKDDYDIELTYEDVIIDGFKAGRTVSYGDYYHFTASSEKGYLVFLDAMNDNIEIIDISIYYDSLGIDYLITYTYKAET